MNLEAQFKLNHDLHLKRYLRENSHWYQALNRDHNNVKALQTAMKRDYRLRPVDKVNDLVEKMELLNMFLRMLQ